jgi:transposase
VNFTALGRDFHRSNFTGFPRRSRPRQHGRLPIDNGIIERLHRRPAVGRRNYLFAGSHEGAKRAAIAYSLCATCNLLEIDPVAYLADVLPALTRSVPIAKIGSLTPASWKDRKQA